MTDFTKRQLDWVRHITTDKALSHLSVRIGSLLALQFLSRAKGYAWPALSTLAAMLSCNEKSIRRGILELVSRGYLKATRSGKGKTNRYELDWTYMSDQGGPRVDTGVQSSLPLTPLDRTPVSGVIGHPCPIHSNHLNEPSEKYIDQNSVSASKKQKSKIVEDQFAEFWQHYPRKASKGSARKAFTAALKKASGTDLIAGATRYSAEREGQDPKFTKYASTWLNGECWLDETPAATAATDADKRKQEDALRFLAEHRAKHSNG